jgi:hypothetical protein
MCTPRLPVVGWTDAPADLNGRVHFAERQNLVSVRVPSHFNWPLPWCCECFNLWLLSFEHEYAIHWLLLCMHLNARYNSYTYRMWHVLLHMACVEFYCVFSSTGNVEVQHCVTGSNAISFHILPSRHMLWEVENMTGNENSVWATIFESCLSCYMLFKNSSPSFLHSPCAWDHESFNQNNGRNLSSIFNHCDVSVFHI